MGSTNKTAYLDLAQFVNEDKPTWRGDVNDDNAKIDAAIRGNGVEIEQFSGATDDIKFNNALAAIAPGGGKIRFRPGKTYTFADSPVVYDLAQADNSPIIIEGWGAIININKPGIAWKIIKSENGARFPGMVFLGGEYNNNDPAATDLFYMEDCERMFWFRVKALCATDVGVGTATGSAWHQSNKNFFSENNHYVECYDPGSKHAITFSNDGSPNLSMARTVIKTLNVQGGTPGEAKINIGDNTALYSGELDGLTGNLNTDAIGIRIAGNMHGFEIIGNLGLENSVGEFGTDFSYYFTVGTLLGGPRCDLKTDVPDNQGTMLLMHPDSSQPDLYGAVNFGYGVRNIGDITPKTRLNSDGPLAVAAAVETTVFSYDVVVGDYRLDAALCAQILTASTEDNVQMRVVGGTATINVGSNGASENRVAANADITKQVANPRIASYFHCSVAGTVLVTVRTGTVAQIVPTTPVSGWANASGATLTQVG